MEQKRARWALIALCWLAFAIRLFRLDCQSLWRDEVDAILFATAPMRDVLQTFVQPGQNGPLYFLALRPWLELTGQSEFSLRFFSLIFGVLTVPLIYRLAHRLFFQFFSSSSIEKANMALGDTAGDENHRSGDRPGASTEVVFGEGPALVASFLAATLPYLVWYGQEGKMYTLIIFLIVLSMERYLAALERGGWQRWLAYVVATTVALYVHIMAALIIPAQILVFLGLGWRDRYRRWRLWLASTALLTLPYIPLLAWQLPLLLEPAQTGFQFLPLHEMLFSLLASYSLGVLQGSLWLRLAPFVALFLAGIWCLAQRHRWRAALWALVCWLFVPLVGLYLVTLIRPLYTARYLIFVLPAFLLLIAAGVVGLARRSRILAGVLFLSLVVMNGWGLWLQATTPLKADYRAATRYVASQLDAKDLILFQIPHGRYSFDYYFPVAQQAAFVQEPAGAYRIYLPRVSGGGGERYRWAEGLYTNYGMSPGEIDWCMTEMTTGSSVVWLVASEAPMWDERNLVQGWLDDHAHLVDEAHFVRVSVYRYKMVQNGDH